MKTIAGGLAAHIATGATTTAFLLLITRKDAEVYAFTSHDEDVTVGAQVYSASPGMDISSIASNAGFAVDNLELSTLHDETVFTTLDILSGRWNNAEYRIDKVNWANPTDGLEPMTAGTLGGVTIRESMVVVELRGLQQYLNQPIGTVSTKTCRANFADFPVQNGPSRCGLTAASFTVAGTVTAVASKQQFTAAGLAQDEDWFGEGIVIFDTGLNANLSAKVKTHATGGVIGLTLPMIQSIQVGDTFEIIAGCRKRRDEDCFTKFSNVVNMDAEPDRPTTDQVTESPEEDE